MGGLEANLAQKVKLRLREKISFLLFGFILLPKPLLLDHMNTEAFPEFLVDADSCLISATCDPHLIDRAQLLLPNPVLLWQRVVFSCHSLTSCFLLSVALFHRARWFLR